MLRKFFKITEFSPKLIQKFFETLLRQSVFKIFHSYRDNSIAHGFAPRKGLEPICGTTFRSSNISEFGFSSKFRRFSWIFPEPLRKVSSRFLTKFGRIGTSGSRRYQNYYQAPRSYVFTAPNVRKTFCEKSVISLDLDSDSLPHQTVTAQIQRKSGFLNNIMRTFGVVKILLRGA